MPTPATPALDGVLVADFSRVLAGPLATMLLGDLGADVVKVERPGTGDDTRTWGPPWTADGLSTYYLGLNRNKRSVVLDLADAADLELAHELAARADVVVESFRPGTIARFGLDRAAIAARGNPGVITCSVTAFGSASSLPGYDLLLQAVGGLMSVTGEDGGRPLRTGAAVVDLVCGLNAAIGILAALHARGAGAGGGELEGQHVETALMDAALMALLNQGSGFLGAGVVPGRIGNRHPSIAPYATYEARDGTFVLAVGNDALWHRLRGVLGLADEVRFATNEQRRARVDELDAVLQPLFATAPRDELVARLREAGVPAGPVNDIAQAFAFARELGLEPTATLRGVEVLRPPVRLERTPASVHLPPPELDEHGDAIRAWLSEA